MSPEESFDPSLADEVAELDEVWQGGKKHERDDQPIGTFQVEIASATLGRSQSSDRLQITYELVIITGEHKGKAIKKYDGLDTPQQASIAQNGLRQIGVDIGKLGAKELPAVLLSLQGKKVTVQTRSKDGFYNIFFRKPITPPKKFAGKPRAPASGGKPI